MTTEQIKAEALHRTTVALADELVANDVRFFRALARVAVASAVVPLALGFLNVAGVL